MNAELAPPSASWEDYVGKAINDLKRRHPTLNLSQIAQRINLNRSTLNRIINEGIKPQLDNYIKIIVGSGNGNELSTALVAYDDSLVGGNTDISSTTLFSKKVFSPDPKLEKILEDDNNYLAYILSLKENGTSIDEINHVLGNRGTAAIDDLNSAKLIEIDGSKIRSIKVDTKTILTSSYDRLKKRISTFSQFYKVEHRQKKRNYIHTLTEGMNQEGILKMQALHKKFFEDMIEITSSKENQGEIPMFSIAFMDSLTSIEFDSKPELLQ